MIIVNYKSKRELKKAIGQSLKYPDTEKIVRGMGEPFFVTNQGCTFRATITVSNGIIMSVR